MTLSRDKKIGIGLVVLAILAFLVFRQVKKDATLGAPQEKTADLPTVSGPDDVDKIVIKNGLVGEVTLEKKGDKWMVTKPLEAPANQANVKSLLDNMKDLKAKEVVASNATDDLRKSYTLDADHALHLQTWKGAEKKVDDYFGKSGGRGEMMMVADKPIIYAASGYSSYLYTRELKGWRDTDIFKFDDANATSLTIEKKEGSFSFTKVNDKWSGTYKGQAIERFDEEKVKDALRAFKSLVADDFGDGKSASDTGLDAPAATVTISLRDNGGKYVLRVGKNANGSARYVQKEGDPTIFVISSYSAEWAVPELTKFQKSLDAGVKDASSPATASLPPGHPRMP